MAAGDKENVSKKEKKTIKEKKNGGTKDEKATGKANTEATPTSGDAKHVADTREAAGLSGRALKARICFNWQRKGRCPKGDSCPKLHAGEPSENRAAHVQKVIERKSQVKAEKKGAEPADAKRKAADDASTASAKRKKKHPPDWVCPRCHNQNWGRREVCNGRVCGGLRADAKAVGSVDAGKQASLS